MYLLFCIYLLLLSLSLFFFFNDTATTEIYTLSLHDALPIFAVFDTEVVFELGLDAIQRTPRTATPIAAPTTAPIGPPTEAPTPAPIATVFNPVGSIFDVGEDSEYKILFTPPAKPIGS